MRVTGSRKPFIFGIILLALLLGGAVPAFSQVTLATFTSGYESSSYEEEYDNPPWGGSYTYDVKSSGGIHGANILFVSWSGLTVSTGFEIFTNYGDFIYSESMFGIGYVYYQGVYFGGLLNCIPRFGRYGDIEDGLLAPTLLAGMDFGGFLLEARVSYIHGFFSGVRGFRATLGVGVNVGSGVTE